ncbi:MAG: hypothetical protein IJD97_08795 [Clostridia bacterium]|nr:hypothetical protein [Clostridia bacterium]
MKKILCLLLSAMLMFSAISVFAEGDIVLLPSNADFNKEVSVSGGAAKDMKRGGYIGYKGIDLTGIQSVTLEGAVKIVGWDNGAALRVMIDNPVSGKQIGTIVMSETGTSYSAYIEGVSGVHDIYFAESYWNGIGGNYLVEKITLSKKPHNDTALTDQVSDEYLRDYYSDTWVSTDEMGRQVAEYPEVGAPKDGRDVMMFFWNWNPGEGNTPAKIISEEVSKYPDALSNPNSEAWKGTAEFFWGESVFGFYSSLEYWVYRQQMELLASAGVDAIILDYTNGVNISEGWNTMIKAMRDAKKEGINVPKFALFVGEKQSETMIGLLGSIYNIGFVENDFTDMWYYLDGKPFMMGATSAKSAMGGISAEDTEWKTFVENITDTFTWRNDGKGHEDNWRWLEPFPQGATLGKDTEDGRAEMTTLGMAANIPYSQGKNPSPYAFSLPYAMGKSFSNVFGDDYSADAPRKAYFFREQARYALDLDPHLVFITGWNEYTADRQSSAWGYSNVFVDTFDTNKSRDFEPTKTAVKDDYYNLLVDFCRKYKGVRPAPLAGAEATIDINGDIAQWGSVTPGFYNYPGLDRDSTSGFQNPETGKVWTYKTESSVRVTESKVARDASNFYFMAKTLEGKSLSDTALYINIDRNPATGFSGYDFVIGRNGGAAVEALSADNQATYVGEAAIVRNGNTMQLSVPKALLSETGTVDFEFKWVHGAFSDVLELYEKGTSAPIGRFNYLYTEIEQKALTSSEKAALDGAGVIKAGCGKMISEGGIKTVYEKDTSVTPFEMNGTLYVPAETFEELMGHGLSKVEYNYLTNIFYFYDYRMTDDLTDIAEKNWYYTAIGSYEARANGRLKTISAPVTVVDGRIYVPVSLFSEVIGKTVTNMGSGVYVIGNAKADAVTMALSYLG